MIGPADDVRYGWRGVSEEGLSLASSRVARNLARSGARVIGLLPVDARLATERLGPALLRLAEALSGFVPGDIGLVDAWPTWPWGEALGLGEGATARIRRLGDRVVEIAPPPCSDAPAAATALTNTLAGRPESIARVLVNLGGFAHPGTPPLSMDAVDGVALLVAARGTRAKAVESLARRLPPGKTLGTILIG
jgi:hypothetical protein